MVAETATEKTSQPNADQPPRRHRRIGYRCAAVVVGLLPFLLLETGLRVAGFGDPAGRADRFAGFGAHADLFERDDSAGLYRVARTRREYFEEQQFPIRKSPSTLRIFCLGGSTVQGRPYSVPTAFPAWVQLELAARDPEHTYEVINCGGVSYASYRLRPVVREVLGYQPDLIILATGHNEFLEDRTYESLKNRSPLRAWFDNTAASLHTVNALRDLFSNGSDTVRRGGTVRDERTGLTDVVKTRLDEAGGYASYHRDDEWQRQVFAQFEDSLRAMVKLCDDAGVPLVMVNLASNLRDCPPYKSEHKPGLSPQDEAAWQQLFDAGGDREADDPAGALEFYRRAEQIDAEYALLAFRIAGCLDRLQQYDEAKSYYLLARDLDVCPLRMLETMHATFLEVAEEEKVPVVDTRRLLESISAEGIPGNDWFLDHVHPTIGGHQRMACAIVEQLQSTGLVTLSDDWPAQARRAAYRKHLEQLGARYLADGGRRIGWLENWARREHLYDETIPADAAGFVRLGFRRLDLDEEEPAWEAFRVALEENRETSARQILDHTAELFGQGRSAAVSRVLQRLATYDLPAEMQAEIQLARLILALESGDRDAARNIYQQQRANFEQADFSKSRWLSVMPEVLQRAVNL